MSKQCKNRRLWRPAVATQPRTTSRLSMSCGVPGTKLHITVPRSGTYIKKPTASCEAAPLWVRASPPSKYSSPKGDRRFPYDVEDDSRSRFAEPREGGEDYPTAALLRSLQWVSDRYVSLQDTALIGVLLWEAAGLRRDAIASYVCLVCCINSCLSVRYITKKMVRLLHV